MDMKLSNLFNMVEWIIDELGDSFIQNHNWPLTSSAFWIKTVHSSLKWQGKLMRFSADNQGKPLKAGKTHTYSARKPIPSLSLWDLSEDGG